MLTEPHEAADVRSGAVFQTDILVFIGKIFWRNVGVSDVPFYN